MKKHPVSLLFMLMLIWVMPAFAGFAQVSVQLRDAISGKPVPNAEIQTVGATSRRVLQTDESGKLALATQIGESWAVRAEGYEEAIFKITQLDKPIEIFLIPLQITLDNVYVRAFESSRPIFEQAAGVHFLERKDIARFQESSLVPVLNTLPGVRMEERSPGSYRVSIRGSSIRSPFGVRNVKVYWNDIPLTEPGGNTPLNLLETDNVDEIEVLKGPTGSVYGAGTGGTLLFRSSIASGTQWEAGTMLGSFGLWKHRVSWQQGNDGGGVRIQATQQKGDGYRDHSAFERKTIQLGGQWQTGEAGKVELFALLTDLQYQTPGGLTPGQLAENPRLARPGSAAQNASILQHYALLGMGYTAELANNLSWKTTAYLNASWFENPFILDYKRDQQTGAGMRSVFTWKPTDPLQVVAGVEYQQSLVLARNFGNRAGVADTLRFDDELRTGQHFFFAQADYRLPSDLILTAGLSINSLQMDIYRLWDAALRTSYQFERTFNGIAMPRIALLKNWNSRHAVHAGWSRGFSPPTIQEIRTNEGSLNRLLEPELGQNLELGHRYRSANGRWQTDLSLFRFVLDETVVTRTDANGVVLFRNAGNTMQHGLEFQGSWYARIPSGKKPGLKLGTAYTLHDFRFENYQQNQNDFSGNRLPGVAPHSLVSTIDIMQQGGYYLNLTHNYTDQIPLNDANTSFAESFHLIQLRAGRHLQVGFGNIEIYGGVDNLLDQQYSLGNDLNAFAQRFFQPAPGRNYFAGIIYRGKK